MKIAFIANVINFNGTYRPDIDLNFIRYTQGGGAVYNADKTSCVVIMDITPENENIIINALKSYNTETIKKIDYEKIEKDYKGFVDIMTKSLAGA